MKLKTIMQDRPDLIVSELSGLAFDSLQCVFRPRDLDIMFTQPAPQPELNGDVWLFIDPAGGGPQSDYALLSFTRHKGLVTVSLINNNDIRGHWLPCGLKFDDDWAPEATHFEHQ